MVPKVEELPTAPTLLTLWFLWFLGRVGESGIFWSYSSKASISSKALLSWFSASAGSSFIAKATACSFFRLKLFWNSPSFCLLS